jgi:hypothetical protein
LIDRPNALLVISPPGGNQGFLLPQLSTTQRLSISPASPADDGLMVFDLTEKSFYYWNNSAWVKGLGDAATSQSLTYDPVTQRLTISGSNNVDLSTLKEVPAQTGQTGKYLTTNGTTLSWATLGALGDITGINTVSGSGLTGGANSGDVTLSVNTDGTTVSVNATNQLQVSNGGVSTNKLADNAVTSLKIADGTVANADLAANSVTTANVVDGAITNVDLAPNSVTSANIVDGTVATADIADNAINSLKIADGTVANTDLANDAVTSAKIQDGTIVTTDIASGGASQVLATNSSGVVSWVPQSSISGTDSQNLSIAGNTLTISGGNTVNLNAAGQVSGPINNLVVTPGTADQVMVTNAGGTATQWVTPGGDVTGSVSNSTVAAIQNRAVSTVAPAVGNALVWNGTTWTPASVAGGSPTTQYYSVDPSNFQGMQPDGDKDEMLGLMDGNDGRYVFAMNNGRSIMAPINLPHGADVQNITVYYEITNIIGVLTPINVRLIMKPLGGGASVDLTNVVIAPLLSLGITNKSGSFSHTVDNSSNSYRLLIKFSNIIDADKASEATQRIYGVRIQYVK